MSNDIKLSVSARDRVRRELRNSPVLGKYLDDPSAIVRMKKDELLDLAKKCEINVAQIVEDELRNGTGLESIFSPEELELYNHNSQYPAFTGTLQIPIKLEIAGKLCQRSFRIEYTYTPEWEYYDLQKKQVMKGYGGNSLNYKLRSHPGKSWVKQPPEWVDADSLFGNPGVLSDAQDFLIDDLIDQKCRAEDDERRRSAGLATA